MDAGTKELLNKLCSDGKLPEETKERLIKQIEEFAEKVKEASTTERMKTGAYAAVTGLFLKASDSVPLETKNDVLRETIDMLVWGIRAETLALILEGEIDKNDETNMVGLYDYASAKANKHREYLHNMITSLMDDQAKRIKESEQVH